MGYEDTRKKILSTLMQRPDGTNIQPDNHQDFALSLLEYIRSVELISGSTLIGVAYEDTIPVQSNTANEAYVAGVAQQKTVTYKNFRDEHGEPIIVTTGEMEAKFVILTWNKQYWSKQEINTNIISKSNEAYFTYQLSIKKTYSSVNEMDEDVLHPIGNDGKSINIGEIVSVNNPLNTLEDAIYSYELNADGEPYWKFQTKLSSLDSRTLDGGRADSVYGGALNIDCGGANQ